MSKIRVMIVDDAVVVRKLVTDVLSEDPSLEVVGTAPNGRVALARIPQIKPDIVILDVEMPEMDGLQTVTAIRKQYPLLSVIMFSSFTQRGAAITIDALSLGANDFVTKPANLGSLPQALQCLRDQLIPKVKLWCWCRIRGIGRGERGPLPAEPRDDAAPRRQNIPLSAAPPSPVGIVAIGGSTGGPNALFALLSELPGNLPVPIVIVQHMPPIFTRLLAERLGSRSALKVCEGVSGEAVRPGCVYIAPGDHHMIVKRNGADVRIQTNQGTPENSCRPAVDVLFRSVVDVYGPGTLGIILTGLGRDGLKGCERIREAGGQVLAQDEATSVVWGMPGFVAKAGLADRELPLQDIAPEIVPRSQRPPRCHSVTPMPNPRKERSMIQLIDHHAIVQRAYGLPPLPQSAARLAHLLSQEESDLGEIIKVIEYDPTLTMRLLRIANSALFGARHRIGTVRESLLRLGTGTVGGFVVGSCVRPLLGKTIPGYNIPESVFWKHSLASAFAAESIQAHSSRRAGQLSFTAALLHDIGKLVLGQFLNPELSAWLQRAVTEGKQTSFQAESEILSVHHGEAGGIIAQHWKLPDTLMKGIIYHHSPEEGAEGICYVTYLANVVAHRIENRQTTDGRSPPPAWVDDYVDPALKWLGMAEKDLPAVCQDARKGLQAVSDHMS